MSYVEGSGQDSLDGGAVSTLVSRSIGKRGAHTSRKCKQVHWLPLLTARQLGLDLPEPGTAPAVVECLRRALVECHPQWFELYWKQLDSTRTFLAQRIGKTTSYGDLARKHLRAIIRKPDQEGVVSTLLTHSIKLHLIDSPLEFRKTSQEDFAIKTAAFFVRSAASLLHHTRVTTDKMDHRDWPVATEFQWQSTILAYYLISTEQLLIPIAVDRLPERTSSILDSARSFNSSKIGASFKSQSANYQSLITTRSTIKF